jgi:ABC-2 type transport system permease protein
MPINNKFNWLLKREFWEYRGAFFWTPAITAAVMLALVVMALIIAETTASRAGLNLGGVRFDELSAHLNEGNAAKLYAGLNIGLISLGFPIGIALFFVLFSYGIGALYNDRADRSVLFWKSLPISDAETVLAKVVAMALIAPVLAVGAMIALHLGFLVILSLWVLAHGINPMLLWSPTHLVSLWVKLILLIPINALWALPSIGWLLLCSSFARSKPFLWAVMLPIFAGVLNSWIGLMNHLSLPSGWYWRNIAVACSSASFQGPGSMSPVASSRRRRPPAGSAERTASFNSAGHLLSSPDFLIGIVAGVAMIMAAITAAGASSRSPDAARSRPRRNRPVDFPAVRRDHSGRGAFRPALAGGDSPKGSNETADQAGDDT